MNTTLYSTESDLETMDKEKIRGIVKRIYELYNENHVSNDVLKLMVRIALEMEMIEGLEEKFRSKDKSLLKEY